MPTPPLDLDAVLQEALAHHQAGSLGVAEALYRHILVVDPSHADGLHLLGVMALQGSFADSAARWVGRAITVNGQVPVFYGTLGNIRKEQDRWLDAVTCYERALTIQPDFADALYNLGLVLQRMSRMDGAIVCFARAAGAKSAFAEALCSLGAVLTERGRLDDAIARCRQALEIRAEYPEALANLGVALMQRGELDAAASCFERAMEIAPQLQAAIYNLGTLLLGQGRVEEAAVRLQRALCLHPGHAETLFNLGNAFIDQGRHGEAIACCERAVRLKPDCPTFHHNLLLHLHYPSDVTEARLFAQARRFGEQFAPMPGPRPSPPTIAEAKFARQRRLRIGYVSADFRAHSVAWFIEPLLRAHDRGEVEVFCYAEIERPDVVTERLQSVADQWCSTVGMADDALAERVRADRIDILVDLAGHTGGNRLLALARRPAPVQVTWLGYPDTNGLAAIDFRLVDAITDPVGAADGWASETLVRLPTGFLCYGPPAGAPEPAEPPCLRNGALTFASFNSQAKLSSATLDVWAALLRRLPAARLLLKGHSLAHAATRARFHGWFAQRGVAAERVILHNQVPSHGQLLALYNQVDIALDPFPYNGTTTTCEALWMGVPVVTLCGSRHAARVGASLLHRVGLDHLVAHTAEDYIDAAAQLAGDAGQLVDLRRSLRPRMRGSPLCDANGFARTIEAAYRDMWQRRCQAV